MNSTNSRAHARFQSSRKRRRFGPRRFVTSDPFGQRGFINAPMIDAEVVEYGPDGRKVLGTTRVPALYEDEPINAGLDDWYERYQRAMYEALKNGTSIFQLPRDPGKSTLTVDQMREIQKALEANRRDLFSFTETPITPPE